MGFEFVDQRLLGVEPVADDDDLEFRMGVSNLGHDAFGGIDLTILFFMAVLFLYKFGC